MLKKMKINRCVLILITVVAIGLLILGRYYPPEEKALQTGTLGGVERAERYRESTISDEHVTLQDAEQFEFFQSAAFQNLAKDPELLKSILSNQFHSIYYTSQMLGLAATADLLQQSEVVKNAELQLNNVDFNVSDLHNLTPDEKLQLAIGAIALEGISEAGKTDFQNNLNSGMSLEQAMLKSNVAESNVFKLHSQMNQGSVFSSNAESVLKNAFMSNVLDLLVIVVPAVSLDLIQKLEASEFNAVEFNYVILLTEYAGTVLENRGEEKLGNLIRNTSGIQAVEIMQNALLKWYNREGGLQGTEFNATEFLKAWSNAFSAVHSDKFSAAELAMFMSNESCLNTIIASNAFAGRMETLQNTSLEGIIFTGSLLFGNEHFQNLMDMASFKYFMNMPAELQQTALQNAGFNMVSVGQ
jgi:hypothetical protein